MNTNKSDTLDALLAVAAKQAMAKDIEEYEREDDELCVPETLAEGVGRIISERNGDGRKAVGARGRISLRKRILIAACAAAITVSLAIAGIASKSADSAKPIFTEENRVITLSFDTRGIRPDATAVPEAPTAVPEGYTLLGERTSDGVLLLTYGSTENDTVLLEVSTLASSPRTVLEDTLGSFEIRVGGKYGGIAAELEDGSAVIFNDGNLVYSLTSALCAEELMTFAEELFRK